MNWLTLSLFTALLWGIGQVFLKKGFSHISPLFNNLFALLPIFTVTIPFSLINGIHPESIPKILFIALIVAAIYTVYYYAIEKGEVSLTGTIIATYPLTTIIFSVIFLHERLNIFQIFAILLILFGCLLIALPIKLRELHKLQLENWVFWAFFGAAILGFGDFLAKVAIDMSDAYTYTFVVGLAYIPALIILYIFDKKGRKLPKFSLEKFLPTILGVFMIEVGIVPFNLAFSKGMASLVGPVSSIFVVITVALAYFFLREKITKTQFFGIISATLGIIFLGLK